MHKPHAYLGVSSDHSNPLSSPLSSPLSNKPRAYLGVSSDRELISLTMSSWPWRSRSKRPKRGEPKVEPKNGMRKRPRWWVDCGRVAGGGRGTAPLVPLVALVACGGGGGSGADAPRKLPVRRRIDCDRGRPPAPSPICRLLRNASGEKIPPRPAVAGILPGLASGCGAAAMPPDTALAPLVPVVPVVVAAAAAVGTVAAVKARAAAVMGREGEALVRWRKAGMT